MLALVFPVLPAAAAATETPAGFRFAIVTDSHVGDAPAKNQTGAVLQAIAALAHAPSLVVHGGDVSEVGARSQYDSFDAMAKALGSIPLYGVPGNHDARWLDMGKGEFQRRYGPAYRSFTNGGVHFVLLDSTVDAQTWGHYPRPELDWLAADLSALPTGTPVVVFAHHPIAYPPLKFTDNDDELLDTLRPYNVVALFTGHGHLDLRWRVNGIPQFMTAAAMDGGFRVVDVSATRLVVYGAKVATGGGAPQLTREAALPLAPPGASAQISLAGVKTTDGRLLFSLTGGGVPAGVKAWARIDQGNWQVLSPQPNGSWQGDLAAGTLPPGLHHLHAYVTGEPVLPGQSASPEEWNAGDLGDGWYAQAYFQTGGTPSDPAMLWQTPVGGPVQGTLVTDGERVYAGSGDGTIYALEAQTGRQVWHLAVGAPVTAGVSLAQGRLFAATVTGEVRAVEATSGQRLWGTRLDAPVLAAPVPVGDLVVVADASGDLYGLDAATGARRWRYSAGAAVGAAPVVAAGVVYFGAWDGKAYALDAATGGLLWQQVLHTGLYYSPANASPLYFRGRVYFTAPTQNRTAVWALSARDGSVVWSSDVPAGYSAPVLFGGLILVTTYGGYLRRLDPDTGKEVLPPVAAGGDVYSPGAAPAGGWAVVGSMGGRLIFLNPAAGARVGEVALGDGWLLGRPLWQDGTAYVGTMSGSLFAVAARPPAAPPLTWGDPSAPPDAGAAQVPDFSDTERHWARRHVALLRALGIVQGDSGGYRPDDPLTRAEWAALIARYLGLSGPPAGFRSGLSDLAGHWAAPYAQAVEARGLMQGEVQPDGQRRFNPDRRLSRAEAVTVLARVIGRSAPVGAAAFVDVSGHWAVGAIGLLAQAGLVTGEVGSDGLSYFRPDRPMTRAEAAVFLVRLALGRDLG